MPDQLVVTLHFDQVGEPEVGLWCDTCLLPSSVSFDGLIALGDKPAQAVTITYCPECVNSKMTPETVL